MSMLSEALFVKKPLLECGRCPLVSSTQGLKFYYSAVASDSKLDKSRREAAMFFSLAERHLKESLVSESLEAASQALAIFQELGDRVGTADALSAIINGLRLGADLAGDTPSEALTRAREEAENFKKLGDKRGESVMLLAVAEINASLASGPKDLQKALNIAEQALVVFREIGDKAMEGSAQLVVMAIDFYKTRQKDVYEAATAALELFREVGDKAGQAKALHGQALSYLISEDFDTAIQFAKNALALYEERKDTKSMIFELLCMAHWLLEQEKPCKAQRAAKTALALSRNLKTSRRSEAVALYLICESLVDTGRYDQAAKIAEEGVDKFKKDGDEVGIASGFEMLVYTRLAMKEYSDALDAADEGLMMVQEFGDKRMELNLLHAICQVRLKSEEFDNAVQAMRDAQSIARDLESEEEEAHALRMIGYIQQKRRNLPDEPGAILEGVEALDAARKLYQQVGALSAEASTVMLKACIESVRSPAQQVLMLARWAQELYQEAGDLVGESVVHGILADMLSGPDNYDDAVEAAEACVENLRDLGKRAAQAAAMYKLAEIHMKNDSGEEAAEVIEEAVELCRRVGAYRIEARLQLLLTQVYVSNMAAEDLPANADDPLPDDYLEARLKAHKAIKEALLVSGKAGDRNLRAAALFWRAEVLVWALKAGTGLQYAEEAVRLFEKVNDVCGQAHSMVLTADVLLMLGEKAKAHDMANEALQLAQLEPEAAEVEDAAQKLLDRMADKKKPAAQVVTEDDDEDAGKVAAKDQASPAVASVAIAEAAEPKGLDPAATLAKVKTLVADVIADDDGFDIDEPFMEAGIDSLGSVQLVSDIGREFRMSLAPSVVFDFPTTRALVDHVVEESKG